MVRCPSCQKELTKAAKSWIYGVFRVDAYSCDCGQDFREYISIHASLSQTPGDRLKLEKHTFMLKLEKGKNYVKV